MTIPRREVPLVAVGEVAPDLFERVMFRLDIEAQRQRARRGFIGSAALLLVALLISLPVWQAFQFNLQQSGFLQYLSLGFHDFTFVAGAWQDFTLSLLESLPIVSTVELLAVLLGVLFTLKQVAQYSRALFSVSSYTASIS